ncbi:hypothetical protein MUP77_21760 [Candidatus Bathyarchaeota archaeon]|nr:hypothetical protein [Candidatus Bathyarchaeota archaeon]
MVNTTIDAQINKRLSPTSLSDCVNGQVERVFKKTESVEITERPFTTEPKHYIRRGCGTVRSRCMEYVKALDGLGYSIELPLETAQQVFSETLGIWDRASLKAYFGTQKGQSKRRIRRWARYQSGTTSVKDLELCQDTPHRVGYLEKLSLVSFQKKGFNWFIRLEKPFLIPTLLNEGCSAPIDKIFNDKISLTPILQGKSARNRLGGVSPREAEESNVLLGAPTNTHTIGGEREISRVKVKHTEYASEHIPELTLEDKFVLAEESKPPRNDDMLERALGHLPPVKVRAPSIDSDV